MSHYLEAAAALTALSDLTLPLSEIGEWKLESSTCTCVEKGTCHFCCPSSLMCLVVQCDVMIHCFLAVVLSISSCLRSLSSSEDENEPLPGATATLSYTATTWYTTGSIDFGECVCV